jgi:hypothetical protein
MWAIEARKFGDNPDYFYMSGLSQAESRRRHSQLSNSGEWAMVRSWDLVAEAEQKKSAERIKNFRKPLTSQ